MIQLKKEKKVIKNIFADDINTIEFTASKNGFQIKIYYDFYYKKWILDVKFLIFNFSIDLNNVIKHIKKGKK